MPVPAGPKKISVPCSESDDSRTRAVTIGAKGIKVPRPKEDDTKEDDT